MNKRPQKRNHFYKALGVSKGYRLAYPLTQGFLFSGIKNDCQIEKAETGQRQPEPLP